MKAVIMAGGSGTRLWPLSRRDNPKQSQPIVDQQTMVQKTYQRLIRLYPAKNIFISTNQAHWPFLRRQLPRVPRSHFILEPARRDTSAAIGLATTCLAQLDPQEVICTVNSDHYIRDVSEYGHLLRTAERLVTRYPNQTVLIGTKPTFPDTASGYIKVLREIDTMGNKQVFSVDRFVEKPDLTTAKRFMASWQYFVNTAWFTFRADAMLDKFRQWLPSSYSRLMKIKRTLGTRQEASTIRREYPLMKKIAIDYGVMEKDRTMLCIPSTVEWIDIGNWQNVYDMLAGETGENVVRGRHVHIDSRGNLLFSYTGKLIATAGLQDMIVIETEDAILVCPKHRAQDVKRIVIELERQKLHHHL